MGFEAGTGERTLSRYLSRISFKLRFDDLLAESGQVQAIGGVNEKIEGFFEVCKLKELTGEQGVLIPQSNVTHLMLRDEVVEAVRDGKFHIYPVSTIDEGIEILTGVEAGEQGEDDKYPQGMLNHAVQARLMELAEKVKSYSFSIDGEKE